jgi:hypothetical protein
MIGRANLAGAVVAHWIYTASIPVFILRLLQMPKLGHWIGLGVLLAAFPLGYLLIKGPSVGRSTLCYLQVGLMLAWLAVEFLVDWWPGIEFRQTRSIVIPYVMLFFAGAGGMLGVAALAGRFRPSCCFSSWESSLSCSERSLACEKFCLECRASRPLAATS